MDLQNRKVQVLQSMLIYALSTWSLAQTPASVRCGMEACGTAEELLSLQLVWNVGSNVGSFSWQYPIDSLWQRTQNQLLEGQRSAEFSSYQLQLTPPWTFLVILKSFISWINMCVWLGLELNCKAVTLQELSLRPMLHGVQVSYVGWPIKHSNINVS